MLLFGMGLSGTFPVIIIPALTGILNDHNQNETLTLTASEASWLGNFVFFQSPNNKSVFYYENRAKNVMIFINFVELIES